MKQAFLLTILILCVGGVASAAEWVNISGGRSSSTPRPGATLRFIVEGASGQTNVINRYLCGDDSSFATAPEATSTASGAVQICKEPTAGDVDRTDCADDLNAGTVTAGFRAIIREGAYVRLDFSAATVGDIFYFYCIVP